MTLIDDAWDDDDKHRASRKKARDGEIAKLAREVAKAVIDEEIEPPADPPPKKKAAEEPADPPPKKKAAEEPAEKKADKKDEAKA